MKFVFEAKASDYDLAAEQEILLRHVSNRKRNWTRAVILCAATVVSTAFTGQIFYFDSARVYHRGPLLFIPMSMQLIMMLIIEGFLISQRQKNRSELLQVADTLSSCAAYRMGAAAFHIRASVLTAQHYLCVIDPVHEYPEPQ